MDTSSPSWRDSAEVRFGLVAVLAVVVALLVYFLLINDDDPDSASGSGADISQGAGPVEVNEGDLAKLGQKSDVPVYWAGDQGQGLLELTHTTDERIFVRYLDEGTEVGSSEPDYLTVGTYPLKDAHDVLEKRAEEEGAVVEEAPDDGLVVTNEASPTSVYIAYPEEDFQIEVYDPDPERALDLAVSGQVEPVD